MGEAEDGKANHYEDYDYDELPEEVRKAANILGTLMLCKFFWS